MKRLLCLLALCAFALACTPDDPEPTTQPTPEVTPTPDSDPGPEPDPEPDPVPDPEPTPDPDPEPEATSLPYLSAIYFHNLYGSTESDYNYSIVLSDVQNCIDVVTGDYYLESNSTYLLLDLFSSIPSEKYNVTFTVPAGEYVFDTDCRAISGTVNARYSYLYVTNDVEGEEIHFTGGVVTVREDGIEAVLVSEDGAEYRFFTPQTAVDNSMLFKGSGYMGEFSTLDADLLLPFEDQGYYAELLGDYYVVGKNDWYLFIEDYDTGHMLMLEVLAPFEDPLPTGEFNVSSDLSLERMVLPGFVAGDGETMWSWYTLYGEDGYSVEGQAPIVSGTLVITDNGDQTYTAVCDFEDDRGHSITGKCTGCFEMAGYSLGTSGYSSQSKSKVMAERQQKPSRRLVFK